MGMSKTAPVISAIHAHDGVALDGLPMMRIRRRHSGLRVTIRRVTRQLILLVSALILSAASLAAAADVRNLSMRLPDGREVLYGLSLPDGYQAGQPRPLVLALHPGGQRMRYYGSAYTKAVVGPAVTTLNAIVVAPDCPSASWADAASDSAVMALLERVMQEYAVDRRRVLVVGFSMGGRGTWFMAAHHRDLFTAAIPMAASIGEPVETLATMPTYVIHSRRDQVVPFSPAEQNVQALERLGRTIKFDALNDLTHYDMVDYVPALRRGVTWVSAQWNAAR